MAYSKNDFRDCPDCTDAEPCAKHGGMTADSAWAKVYRQDRGQFKKTTRMDNGMVRIEDATLTRTGVFTYVTDSGDKRRELRLADEVFKADSLDTLKLATVTRRHPAEAVTADNYKAHAVGTVGENVGRRDDFVVAPIMLSHKDGIDFVEKSGHRELSCGYTCDLEPTSGIFEGERFDAVQRNIRYNHVALVEKGRAGPQVRLNMDSADQELGTTTEDPTVKINLDGLDFECAEPLAQAITKLQTAAQGALAQLKTDADSLQAKVDVISKELESEKKLRNDSVTQLPELVKARVSLEKTAGTILGGSVKLDSLSDLEIKKAVIAKAQPGLKLDGQTDAYIQAAFDLVSAVKADETPSLDALRANVTNADGAGPTIEQLRLDAMVRESELWKQPLTANKTNGGRLDSVKA